MRRLLVVLTASSVAASTARAQQTVPVAPPPAAAVPPAALPAAEETLLPNGLRLVVIQQHRQPVVSINLAIPAGTAFDPDKKEGLSDMLAALMTRGAGKRSAADVADAVEAVGGSFSATAGPDVLTLSASVLSSQVALGFELISDAVLRPTLAPEELESLRAQTVASLTQGLEDPGSLAVRVFLVATYQRYPYGRRPAPATVGGITRNEILAFYKARVRPAGSTLVIAGDITAVDARRLALKWLGDWNGARPAPLAAPTTAVAPKGIILVHAGGVKQANIIIGGRTFAGTDTGYYGAAVLSQIIGDARFGRFPTALNGQHSWAPASGASYLRTSRLGLFQATASTGVGTADSALREMYAQVARLRTDLVTAPELERVREQVAGSFALRLQTVSQLSASIAELRQLGLPATYLSTFRPRVLALTATQIRAAARRLLPENGTVTVVVGDASRLYEPLSRIGPVRLFGADGSVLTPESIQPKPVPLAVDLSGVKAGIDSMAILAEGKTVGLQVTSLSGSGDSLVYLERSILGTALNQTTTVVFDTALRMRRLDQDGTAQGQHTSIKIAYGSGRVRGTATVPAAGGPKTTAIDTAVSGTIIDDNAVQAILPLLKWDVNTRWTFEVFSSGENRIRTLTLTAADLTRIRVPAGEFECYRADVTGGPQPLSFYVTSTAPHRVVKIELEHAPIEFVALNP